MAKEHTIYNARIVFKNFSGLPGPFNKEGERNFVIGLDDLDLIDILRKEKWNVKERVDDDGNVIDHILSVKFSYDKGYPPKIWLADKVDGSRKLFDGDTISRLDSENIEEVDITISPYNWNDNGEIKVSAWCRTMYVYLSYDVLDVKWDHIVRSGCVLTDNEVVGKAYICNLATGKFEEVDIVDE